MHGIVIICTKRGKPKYVRSPISLRKKVKKMFGLEHMKESPSPLSNKAVYFYVGWEALSPQQQKMALEEFSKVP